MVVQEDSPFEGDQSKKKEQLFFFSIGAAADQVCCAGTYSLASGWFKEDVKIWEILSHGPFCPRKLLIPTVESCFIKLLF